MKKTPIESELPLREKTFSLYICHLSRISLLAWPYGNCPISNPRGVPGLEIRRALERSDEIFATALDVAPMMARLDIVQLLPKHVCAIWIADALGYFAVEHLLGSHR
jgi:hypothetical protein